MMIPKMCSTYASISYQLFVTNRPIGPMSYCMMIPTMCSTMSTSSSISYHLLINSMSYCMIVPTMCSTYASISYHLLINGMLYCMMIPTMCKTLILHSSNFGRMGYKHCRSGTFSPNITSDFPPKKTNNVA